MFRKTAVLIALPLAASLAAAPAASLAAALAGPVAAAPYDAGLSQPHEDSVYPGKGDPRIDTLHYDLRLLWMPNVHVLKGWATIDFRATRSAATVQLDLAAPLKVKSVRIGGRSVPSTHVGKTLRIIEPVVKDRRYRVRIGYQGHPQPVKAPTHRGDFDDVGWHTTRSGQAWAMQEPFGAFTWFPVNDQPSDKALYDVRVNVPKKWVGISNGEMTSRVAKGTRTLTTFSNRDPMASYLVTLAIGPYKRFHQTGPHGLPMDYWVPRNKPGLAKPLMRTPSGLRFLESKLGPYPFDRVGIVVTPSDSAMETQTMITFGSGGYDYGNRNVRETVIHELAHAWYGDTVTPRDWRDLWMNEGMATYIETRYAVSEGWKTWSHQRREWARYDQLYRDLDGPPGRYHSDEFAAANVYYSPALMLDRLRLKVGNAVFDGLVRDWPQQHLNSNQTRSSYIHWVENETGKELTPFFDTWLNSKKSPA